MRKVGEYGFDNDIDEFYDRLNLNKQVSRKK